MSPIIKQIGFNDYTFILYDEGNFVIDRPKDNVKGVLCFIGDIPMICEHLQEILLEYVNYIQKEKEEKEKKVNKVC